MKVVMLQNDTQLSKIDIAFLGRKLTLLESIKLKGIGSPKFIYQSGIIAFDDITSLGSATNYCSFELLTEGFVLRFKKRDINKACLIKYEDVANIDVISQKIRIIYRGKIYIRHSAKIFILLTENKLELELQPTFYKAGIKFFKKKPFEEKCNFTLLPEVLEKENIDISLLESIINSL